MLFLNMPVLFALPAATRFRRDIELFVSTAGCIIISILPFVALTAIFRGAFIRRGRFLASTIAVSATISGETSPSGPLHLDLLSSNRFLSLLLDWLCLFLLSSVPFNFAFLKILELGEATLKLSRGGEVFDCFASSVL